MENNKRTFVNVNKKNDSKSLKYIIEEDLNQKKYGSLICKTMQPSNIARSVKLKKEIVYQSLSSNKGRTETESKIGRDMYWKKYGNLITVNALIQDHVLIEDDLYQKTQVQALDRKYKTLSNTRPAFQKQYSTAKLKILYTITSRYNA